MAQKLRDDKIGTLTHSAGNITMAASMSSPAYLTIGGRQYTITSNLVVALPTLTANQRYQVFAVVSGGSVILAISTNENSVGPAGYTSWKLVGSLYANGMNTVAFGSFIVIDGKPASDHIIWHDQFIPGGVISNDSNYAFWYRDGDKIKGKGRIRIVTVNTTDARINMPTNISMNVSNLISRQSDLGRVSKMKAAAVSTDTLNYYLYYNSTYPNTMNVVDFTGSGQYPQLGWDSVVSNGDYLDVTFEIPVSGWSNTPIKDL